MRETLSQIAVGVALLGVPTMITGAAAQSAAAVVGTDEVRANVETVDQQKRMILLRGPTGALLTVHAGPEIRNLAQVKPDDRLVIRYTEAVAAQIVRPSGPQAGSTTSVARANPGERPAGAVVDQNRL